MLSVMTLVRIACVECVRLGSHVRNVLVPLLSSSFLSNAFRRRITDRIGRVPYRLLPPPGALPGQLLYAESALLYAVYAVYASSPHPNNPKHTPLFMLFFFFNEHTLWGGCRCACSC